VRPADTSPEAWQVWLDLVRKMTPSERLQRTFEYSAFVRNLAESTLRSKHPEASEREIFLRAARQRLGPELFERAYGGELHV
jgi:hypothetical protein